MEKILTPKIKSILIRAIKTFCQTAASMIAVGAGFADLDWIRILSVSGVAFLLSILTNIGGTPESTYKGELIFEADADGDPTLRVRSDDALQDILANGVESINMRVTNNFENDTDA